MNPRTSALLLLISSSLLACSETTVIVPDGGGEDSATMLDSLLADSSEADATDSTADSTAPADSSTPESGPSDTAVSDAPAEVSETSGGAIVKCNDVDCAVGQVCCTSSALGEKTRSSTACPTDFVTLACDGPEDCGGATPFCCADADLTGSGFMCAFAIKGASCRATCPSSIPSSCPISPARVRPCHGPADCTEMGVKNCCRFNGGIERDDVCIGDGLIADNAVKCF